MSQTTFKYLNLAQTLVREIVSEGLRPGDRLPTEDVLVRRHGLSRITVRRALSMLEADGLISRKRKAGTFVNRSIEQLPSFVGIPRGTIAVILSPLQASAVDEDNIAASHALHVTLRAIEEHLGDHGFNMQVLSVGRHELQDRSRLAGLLERDDVRGICVHGSNVQAYRELFGATPAVYCCTYSPVESPWVGWNIEDAVCYSIRHLIEKGHERIALVCGPWVGRDEFPSFIRGYRRAFDQAARTFRRNLLYHAYDCESLPELLEQVIDADPSPTAILAQDWRVARAALSSAQRLGRAIPDDLSIMALGENAQHISSSVTITAFVPDNAAVGRTVARILIDLVDGKAAPSEPVFVPGRLIEQNSIKDVSGQSSAVSCVNTSTTEH